ncbi:MAG: carboxypeptidase regulatory-like domain-containing protein, partial [Acidobacteriaceae bacterium]|nr:carboxypeptidase regulatory-like domain-containing protein [Acidobacteriaceae bacterium]
MECIKRSFTLFAILVLALPAFSQSQAINGSIRGQVTDQTGGPVANASVTIQNAATGFTRDSKTDKDGYYVFPNLPLGPYKVTIESPGFSPESHSGVILDAGTQAVIDAQLKVGTLSTAVEVTGGAPIVDPARVDVGRTITHEETSNLPLTSRNPYNFVLFQPGVSGHPNPELGIPRLLNTNGLVDHVSYQLDGTVDTETDRTGLRLFAIANSYVNEVQTVSSSFAPEFGRTAGDVYNVITQSGSNQFHGTVQFVGRPLDLVARPILATHTTPVPAANDFSANSGGRIIKDKLFFFASYEHIKRATPTPVTITTANAAAIGIPANLLATAQSVQHAQWVDVRFDWTINQNNQFFVRYNYFRNRYPFNTNDGGLYALDAASDFRDRAHV